jgi:hypothetical protein
MEAFLMATWEQFANAEPNMAKVLRHLLGWIPIAYLATVRRDGSPRLHPFVPVFADDRMYIAIPEWSPKRHDLRGDGRFAMHALPGKRDDEFYMTGRATLVADDETRSAVVKAAKHTIHKSDDVFELLAEYVMTAYWENQGQPNTYPVRQEWRPTLATAVNGARAAKVKAAVKPRTRVAAGSRATRKGS